MHGVTPSHEGECTTQSPPSGGAKCRVEAYLLGHIRGQPPPKKPGLFQYRVTKRRGFLANDGRPFAPGVVYVSCVQVSYMAQRSVEDSLAVEAGENAWVLGVSYLCMFLYVALILGNPSNVIR